MTAPVPGQAARDRWRKRPVVVDAVRWTGDNLDEVYELAGCDSFDVLGEQDRLNCDDPEATASVFDKLHSTWVLVYTGQWVIKGIKGEFYPCADDVFRETYEPAEQEQPADVSPHLGCAVCASGVTAPHGAGGTPGQAAYPLQSAVSALQRLADKTPMGNWDEPEPAEVALRRDYAQAALDAIAAQERHAAPGESSPLGLKHAVTSNRLGHALAALRELREATFDGTPAGDIVRSALDDDAAIRDNVELTREPQPAPGLAAAMAEVRAADVLRRQLADLTAGMHARADAPVPPHAVDVADRIVRAQVLHEYAARIRQLLEA